MSSKESRMRSPGVRDLGVAIGALHEEHLAAGAEAMGDAVESLGDRGDRAGDHALRPAGRTGTLILPA